MQSIEQRLSIHQSRQSVPSPKKTSSRAVLGLSSILSQRSDNTQVRSDPVTSKLAIYARSSLSSRRRRKNRQSQTITSVSFFEPDSTVHVENTPPPPPPPAMTATPERRSRPSRRQVLRVDAQDGPWTVSVAENPHQPSSFTLYVKSECPVSLRKFPKTCSVAPSCYVVPVLGSHFPFHFNYEAALTGGPRESDPVRVPKFFPSPHFPNISFLVAMLSLLRLYFFPFLVPF
jgi:hypothetical protein